MGGHVSHWWYCDECEEEIYSESYPEECTECGCVDFTIEDCNCKNCR